MKITIEQANPKADYPRIAELLTIEMGEVVTDEELFEEDDEMLPNSVRYHLVAKILASKLSGMVGLRAFKGNRTAIFICLSLLIPPIVGKVLARRFMIH